MTKLFKFFFALALGSAASIAIAAAAGGFTYGRYDCGPYRNQFRIISCDARVCQLYTYDPGARGGGFSSTMDLASLRTLLASGAPGNSPCRLVGANGTAAAMSGPKPTMPRKASSVALGRYECYMLSSGHLYAAMAENFTILGGGSYRDNWGRGGTYSFAGGQIVFHGAALNGRRAVFKAGIPPFKSNPNNITFLRANGELADSCDDVTR